MGGIVIDIWEKSNSFGSFGSQKGAKTTIFVLMVGLTRELVSCLAQEKQHSQPQSKSKTDKIIDPFKVKL